MNQRRIDAEPVDTHVRLDTREIGDFSYITAEIGSLRQSGVTRDHTRLIGKGKRGVTGHPLVYSDSYSGSHEDVYVYARHRLTQKEFFSRLDLFLRLVRRNRGLVPVPATCLVSDRGRVRGRGRCGSRTIFS